MTHRKLSERLSFHFFYYVVIRYLFNNRFFSSSKDLTNAKTLAQGSANECIVSQSSDVPMDSVNA